jgi:cytochrome c peroxidase
LTQGAFRKPSFALCYTFDMTRRSRLLRWLAGPLPVLFAVTVATQETNFHVESDSPSARVELGRLLFWDPILSGDRDTACATCHHPLLAYADGRDLSLGTGSVGLGPHRVDRSNGRIPSVKRNAPTILNTAFNGVDDRGQRRRGFDGTLGSVDQTRAPMFWDRRARSLETQALEPIKALEELRGTAYAEDAAVDAVVTRLGGIPEYVRLFRAAFGPGASIDASGLSQAIAAFERTLVAMNSPFDRFRGGDVDALTAQQRRGLELFDRVGCDRCHDGPMFSDFDVHAEGVREHQKLTQPDSGDGRFRFRTPSLRNVALTAPYMHNGTLATLQDVLQFYDRGRSENANVSHDTGRRGRGDSARRTPRLDRDFRRVDGMSDNEMKDIIAFLESLTDANFDKTIPSRVPSGLNPGGAITRR